MTKMALKSIVVFLSLSVATPVLAQNVPLADTLRDAIITPLDELPEHVPAAFLAAEDYVFFHRPTWKSSITRHLSRLTLEPAQSREVGKRINRAVEIVAVLDHEGLLEVYMNLVYFGRGATGIEAAAKVYFGVPANELTAPQAVYLAMLIKSPTIISNLDVEKQERRYDFVRRNLLKMSVLDKQTTTELMLSQMPTPSP